MSRPVRKRRLSLGREFRNSVKAGPRVWLIAAAAFLGLLLLPMLSKLVSLLAMIAVGIGLFFIAPVILSVVVGGLVRQFKQAVVFRAFAAASVGRWPAMKRAGEMLANPTPGSIGRPPRQADVIDV